MKPRPPVNTILAVMLTLVTLVFTDGCLAQGAPPALSSSLIRKASLSEDEKSQVRDVTRYWSSRMTSGQSTPTQIETARDELLRPIRSAITPSAAFRFEYSAMIIESLSGLLDTDQNPHATINALIVFGELGSRNAINLLVHHADSTHESRVDIRIKASMNCKKLLAYKSEGLKPRDIGVAMRGLRRAATRETDPIALRHQLLAILSIDTPDARDAAVVALDSVVDKITAYEDGKSPLIETFYVVVYELRTSVINLRGPRKIELGQSLAPCLVKFLTAASAQWDSAHQTEEDVQRYAKPIRISEAILKILINATPNISPPNTSLRTNWEDHSKKKEFIRQVNLWDSLLREPPFSR